MKIISIFGLLTIFILTAQAGAEFYKYLDPHGNMIYTDDLHQVPEDQRSNPELRLGGDRIPPFGSDDTKHEAIKTAQPADQNKSLEKERLRLDSIKEKLEKEFRFLVQENAGLKEEQKAAVTPEQVKAINRKTVDFNTRLHAYQEKKAVYDAQIEDISKQLMAKDPSN
ncbi:MAG: DUF4124 domain-containing protein [Desulfobacteraceae bacterium]|jgi:hypothetical protein